MMSNECLILFFSTFALKCIFYCVRPLLLIYFLDQVCCAVCKMRSANNTVCRKNISLVAMAVQRCDRQSLQEKVTQLLD